MDAALATITACGLSFCSSAAAALAAADAAALTADANSVKLKMGRSKTLRLFSYYLLSFI